MYVRQRELSDHRHQSVIELTPIEGCNEFVILFSLSDEQQAIRSILLDGYRRRCRVHRCDARRIVEPPKLTGRPTRAQLTVSYPDGVAADCKSE